MFADDCLSGELALGSLPVSGCLLWLHPELSVEALPEREKRVFNSTVTDAESPQHCTVTPTSSSAAETIGWKQNQESLQMPGICM